MGMVLLFLVVVALSVPTSASAVTSVVGTAGCAWQDWASTDLNRNVLPYFDGPSSDPGGFQGVGYWMTDTGYFSSHPLAATGPGVAYDYWGTSTGGYDQNFYFQAIPASQTVAAIQIEIAGFAGSNVFGWYDTTTMTRNLLFDGADNSTSRAATFTPSTNYGFYLSVQEGGKTYTYYTQSSKNMNDTNSKPVDIALQHFVAFQDLGNSVYYLGMEDLKGLGDKDYNDMVVKVSVRDSHPVPEPSTLLLVGSGLVGLVAFRKRFKRA